jgi:pilus assembly protein Flp/PilA
MLTLFGSTVEQDDGQGLAEYALILGLIAVVAIVALLFLGGSISTMLSTVGSYL